MAANPIQTAMRRFVESCRRERELQRRGFSMAIDDFDIYSKDDGTIGVMASIAGCPIGVALSVPADVLVEPVTRHFLADLFSDAGDSADAGFRPGAVRLATVGGRAAA